MSSLNIRNINSQIQREILEDVGIVKKKSVKKDTSSPSSSSKKSSSSSSKKTSSVEGIRKFQQFAKNLRSDMELKGITMSYPEFIKEASRQYKESKKPKPDNLAIQNIRKILNESNSNDTSKLQKIIARINSRSNVSSIPIFSRQIILLNYYLLKKNNPNKKFLPIIQINHYHVIIILIL
jgi:hypothetical protein